MLIKITLICLMIFGLDQLFLWFEHKGWLYYRKQKSPGGFVGSALLELNSIFQPSARHVIELKQNKVQTKRSNADSNDF